MKINILSNIGSFIAGIADVHPKRALELIKAGHAEFIKAEEKVEEFLSTAEKVVKLTAPILPENTEKEIETVLKTADEVVKTVEVTTETIIPNTEIQ